MSPSAAALLARLLSLGLYLLLARWYVVPWLRGRNRADALIPLLWVHAFRYVALHLVDAQTAGYAISDALRNRIIDGDLVAMCLAVAAIAALRARSRISIPLVVLLTAETVTFIASLILRRGREEVSTVATGINWLVQSFYVPLVPVTLGLIVWQLYSRRHEPLADPAVKSLPDAHGEQLRSAGVAMNAFGWRPEGTMFRAALAAFGSVPFAELDALTGIVPRITATSFGIGRYLEQPARRAFLEGVDRSARRAFHAYLRDARRCDELYEQMSRSLAGPFRDLPVLTIFGERNDPFRFQARWKAFFPSVREVVIPKGNHFPMCDAPDSVAQDICSWHHDEVSRLDRCCE